MIKKNMDKKCIAATGQWCDCQECQDNSNAWDVIEDKQVNVSALDALLDAGFTHAKAKKQIEIMEDLGIFTPEELGLNL